MRTLALIAFVTMAALALTAAAVGPGHDVGTLVSPPEVVAEEFTRGVAAGRYDRAAQKLEPTSGISVEDVRRLGESLKQRGGRVHQVEGEARGIEGDSATASVIVTASKPAAMEFSFVLVRRHGEWKIASIGD